MAEARIFIRSNNTWALHGRFETVIERSPTISWDSSTDVPKLIILAEPLEPETIVAHMTQTAASVSIPAVSIPADSIPAVRKLDADSAAVVGLLGIPVSLLARPNPIPLQLGYQKYKAVNKGWKIDVAARKLAETWPFPEYNKHQFIEIFVSKTTWYEHFKHFAKVEKDTALEMWLEGGDDAPSGFMVFGVDKEVYSWPDLCKVLEGNSDIEDGRSHRKGKGKGTGKAVGVKGKGKAKEVEVEEPRKSKRKKADDSPKQKKSKGKKKKTL